MKRHFSDDQLKALANVFDIDTGGAFDPITDEGIAEKAEAIFPKAKREEMAADLKAALFPEGMKK